eukprot:s2204_g6.t1
MASMAVLPMFVSSLACLIGNAWAGGLRGNLQNATETTRELPTALPLAAAGSCTAEDESKMHDFGPGYAEGTFPFVVSYCERKSWSLDGGFYTKEFESCVISHTGLTPPCAACFSKSAIYTYENCKFACWFHSWCGRECLRCVEESAPEVRQLSLKTRVCEELRVFALLPDADCSHHCRGKDRLTNIPVFKSGTAPDVQVRVQLDTSSLWPKVTGIQCSCVDARNEASVASCPKEASLPEAHLYWRQRILTTSVDPMGRAKTLPPPFAESQWPEGIVEFLTSLITDATLSAVNHGLGDRAAELRAAAGGLLRGPDDPDIARVMQDFPQLGTVDAYAKAQRSPLFFLQLAAPLWMAATIGEESLRQTLEDYRNQEATMQADGVPLLRVALHTPVIYKSPQKGGKLFCGAILMFVLEHVQYLDSTKVAVALEHLLEFQAEPNSTYEMFPIGINCAIGHFSALCLTGKNPPMVEALLEKRAEPHCRNLLNYFPSGSPLWTAVWRRQDFAIRKLLDAADTSAGGTDAEGVNRHGWHPDRAPLVLGQRAQGYNVLELASLTMGLEQVKLLVERKAMLGDELPHVLANCPAATARVLSQHVFCTAAHAASIVNGSALDQMNGMRVELVLCEVLKHEEARACLEKAIFKASEVEKVEGMKQRRWQLKNPQGYKEMMEALIKVIHKAPTTAGRLLDSQAGVPDMADSNRFPLTSTCLFDKQEPQHVAYSQCKRWEKGNFADSLAPPPTSKRSLRRLLSGLDGSKSLCLQLCEILRAAVPDRRRADDCAITVLRYPNVIRMDVVKAMRALPQEQLVGIFKESFAFRGIAYHLWKLHIPLCCLDVSTTVLQFVSLLVWWRNFADGSVVRPCWCIFTACVLLDVSTVLLDFCGFCLPLFKLLLQAGFGLWMVSVTWGGDETAEFRPPMATNLALGILGTIYELRLFYPLGLPLGGNLLPIMRAAQTGEFIAMLILLASVLVATYLAACVEFFQDPDALLPVAVRTWQTLIIGESALYDVDDYGHHLLRYLCVSALFFVCFVVMMNIFINVTGAGYDEERAKVLGSLSAERFATCLEFSEITIRGRIGVLVVVTLAVGGMAVWDFIEGRIDALLLEGIALSGWICLYSLQWFCARQATRPLHQLGSPPRYLWICRPVEQEEPSEAERFEALEQLIRQMSKGPSGGSSGGDHFQAALRPRRPSYVPASQAWLREFLEAAQLDLGKYLEKSLLWAEENDIVHGDLLGGDASAANEAEALSHLEMLIAELCLSAAPAARLRKTQAKLRRAQKAEPLELT